MAKTEVYSWRLSPRLKMRLEEAARARETSVAKLVDELVRKGLDEMPGARSPDEQRRLHAEVEPLIGCLDGEDLSTRVRETVRERVARRHGG